MIYTTPRALSISMQLHNMVLPDCETAKIGANCSIITLSNAELCGRQIANKAQQHSKIDCELSRKSVCECARIFRVSPFNSCETICFKTIM